MGRNKSKSTLTIMIFALIIAGIVYVYTSSTFERDAATIEINNNEYWNLKKPINISVTDESGVKLYKVILKTAKGEQTLKYEQY